MARRLLPMGFGARPAEADFGPRRGNLWMTPSNRTRSSRVEAFPEPPRQGRASGWRLADQGKNLAARVKRAEGGPGKVCGLVTKDPDPSRGRLGGIYERSNPLRGLTPAARLFGRYPDHRN